MRSDLADVNMGKYYPKLHRCSSVPNGSTNGMYEINSKERKSNNIDTFDILFNNSVRDTVAIEIRSRFISDWNCVKNGLYKSSVDGTRSNCDESTSNVEAMPSRKISVNRRSARGYIFCDMKEDDVSNLLRGNICTECSNVVATHVMRKRRCALGNIFDGVKTADMDRLLDCESSEYYAYDRRCGLADIFDGVPDSDVSRVTMCENEDCEYEDCIDECSTEFPENFRRERRCGLGNIFSENIDSDSDSSDVESYRLDVLGTQSNSFSNFNSRRFALPNIFHGVTEDDLQRILREIDPIAFDHDTIVENGL